MVGPFKYRRWGWGRKKTILRYLTSGREAETKRSSLLIVFFFFHRIRTISWAHIYHLPTLTWLFGLWPHQICSQFGVYLVPFHIDPAFLFIEKISLGSLKICYKCDLNLELQLLLPFVYHLNQASKANSTQLNLDQTWSEDEKQISTYESRAPIIDPNHPKQTKKRISPFHN